MLEQTKSKTFPNVFCFYRNIFDKKYKKIALFNIFFYLRKNYKIFSMKKIIAIVLLVAGIYGGYKGYQIIDGSSKGLEIADLELKAEDKDAKTQGYLFLGLGVIGVVAGAVLLARKQ
ncbi:Hypothetical protein Ccan_11050 [Capnocytophaga canimorsus Cc5]|uniref:DUF3185 family protein n=2 Tax=Capnocytophaga canimorsus TaxID=28188 RepID=F9YVQ7_CAPCC|nr:Hypothetical protein Ccan_11050 [Capnocytophaga canimorsus Cc5]